MKKLSIFTTLLILVFALAACGPSAEESIAMTEAAYTATPSPTSTPTPLPFDLSLQIQDAEGGPIEAAIVSFNGDTEKHLSDTSGMLSFSALPAAGVVLNVSAQGYLPTQAEVTLEHGPNDLTITLERDPYGVLPAEACLPGEELLHIEDFQDGRAQQWQNIDLAASGWQIGEFEGEEGNLVAYNAIPANHPHGDVDDVQADNAVWRFDFYKSNNVFMSFNNYWSGGFEDENGTLIEDSRYMVIVQDPHGVNIQRQFWPASAVGATSSAFRMPNGQWLHVEISRFEDTVEMWVDGALIMRYRDPRPLPGGGFGFEIFEQTPQDSMPTFDNIVICGLSAPYEPPPVSEVSDGS